MLMIPVIIGLGAWVIFDGIASIIIYEKQSWVEQAVRVIRVAVGGFLMYLGWII